jgi:hypothetical protein
MSLQFWRDMGKIPFIMLKGKVLYKATNMILPINLSNLRVNATPILSNLHCNYGFDSSGSLLTNHELSIIFKNEV